MIPVRHWPCLAAHADGCVLTVHVQPGARKTGVQGFYGDALKLRIAAQPVDGRANEAVAALLAEGLGLAKHDVILLTGQTARRKRFLIVGMSEAELACHLFLCLEPGEANRA